MNNVIVKTYNHIELFVYHAEILNSICTASERKILTLEPLATIVLFTHSPIENRMVIAQS